MPTDYGTTQACSDALDEGCPDRKNCVRWVDRQKIVVWIAYAKHRTATGCPSYAPIEPRGVHAALLALPEKRHDHD